MSEKKPLNIGLVGYGFMGRTHSNGYKRANDFFPDLEYRPVLKAICARNEERAQAFASAVVGMRGATVDDPAFYQPFLDTWNLS